MRSDPSLQTVGRKERHDVKLTARSEGFLEIIWYGARKRWRSLRVARSLQFHLREEVAPRVHMYTRDPLRIMKDKRLDRTADLRSFCPRREIVVATAADGIDLASHLYQPDNPLLIDYTF